MESSDNTNLDCVEPWLLRPTIAASDVDPWFSYAFDYDVDTLITKALTSSVSAADIALSELLNPVTNPSPSPSPSPGHGPSPSPTPDTPRCGQSLTISGSGSGSDPEIVSKRKPSVPGPVSGRIRKRKSRASKKSPTTFITADAANFRQMVQQVTGVKFPSSGQYPSMAQVLKPEPQRIGVAGAAVAVPIHGCLPTLDTSAFLLDHHHQQVAAQSGATMAFAPPPAGDGGAVGGRTGLDFDSFACFPTLESWKVM